MSWARHSEARPVATVSDLQYPFGKGPASSQYWTGRFDGLIRRYMFRFFTFMARCPHYRSAMAIRLAGCGL